MKVCRYVPNRTEPRKWKLKDIERIARHMVEDGVKPGEILGAISLGAGVEEVVCRGARATSALTLVGSIVKQAGGVLAVTTLVNAALTVLSKGAFKKLPVVNRIAFLLILVLATFRGILDAMGELLDNLNALRLVSSTLHTACRWIKESRGEPDDGFTEALEHQIQTIIEQYAEEIDELR